jgi:hypothetical protein
MILTGLDYPFRAVPLTPPGGGGLLPPLPGGTRSPFFPLLFGLWTPFLLPRFFFSAIKASLTRSGEEMTQSTTPKSSTRDTPAALSES